MDIPLISRIFKGNEEAYGTYIGSGEKDHRGKVKGSCRTLALKEGEQLSSNETLWNNHLSGVQSIGVIPINKQHECYWGCIDIDSYEGFDHKHLLSSIEKAKLPFIVIRSKSGGAHVYVFFKTPVKAKLLRKKLEEASSLLGFKGSEVFPKQNELPQGFFGNYVNTPYFNSDKTDRYAMVIENKEVKNLSLAEFYEYYENTVIESLDKLEVKTDVVFPDGPPCNNCIALRGCDEGGRNNYLFNIAVMYRKMHEESGEDWFELLRQANKKYIKNPLNMQEVSRTYASVMSHSEADTNVVTEPGEHLDEESNTGYHYLCKQEPLKSYCNRSVCVTRKFGVTRTGDHDNSAFEIQSIHKVLDDPIIYYITFESGYVMRADIKQISDQKLWRDLVCEHLDFKPPRMANEDFDNILNGHLRERLEYVQLPEGITRNDRTRAGIVDWLLGTGHGDDKESILTGNSFHDTKKNKIYFKYDNLRAALISTKCIRDTQKDAHILSDFLKGKATGPNGVEITNPGLEAETVKININGSTVHVWSINAGLLDLNREELEPKEIIKEDAF